MRSSVKWDILYQDMNRNGIASNYYVVCLKLNIEKIVNNSNSSYWVLDEIKSWAVKMAIINGVTSEYWIKTTQC